jgi:hypothetical protein
MKRMIGGLTVLLVLFSTHSAVAQQPAGAAGEGMRAEIEGIVERSGIRAAVDSIAVASAPEIERTLEELTGTLNVLASRIANDPELRVAAVRAAQSLVGVAQVVVVEQSSILQEALRAAADRIGNLPVPQEVAPQPR